jgi:hypothetical protein
MSTVAYIYKRIVPSRKIGWLIALSKTRFITRRNWKCAMQTEVL